MKNYKTCYKEKNVKKYQMFIRFDKWLETVDVKSNLLLYEETNMEMECEYMFSFN